MSKKQAAGVKLVDQKAENKPDDDGDDIENQVVSDFLVDFNDGDDFTVSVYRAEAGRAQGRYLFQFPLANKRLPELLDELRDNYGGGEFRAFVYDGTKRVANKSLIVEAPMAYAKKDEFGRAVTVGSAADRHVSAAPAGGTTVMDLMLAQLREDARAAREEARAANDRTNNLMLQVVQNLGKGSAQGTSAGDVISLITALDKIKGGGGGSMKETLDVLITAKGLFGDGGDSGGSLIDKLVSAASPVLQKMAEAGAFSPAPVVAAGGGEKVVPAAPKRDVKSLAADDSSALIRIMCKAAMSDFDYCAYAEVAIDMFGDEAMRMVCFADENFEKFMGGIPDNIGEHHRDWFDGFRGEVIRLLTPDDAGGDAGDGDDNGKADPDKEAG